MTEWPAKMITQAEAFAKAAEWPICAAIRHNPGDEGSAQPGSLEIVLLCRQGPMDKPCGQSMGQLRRDEMVYNGSLDQILSMVLRHMVMAHDEPLNTRSRPGQGAMENTQDTAGFAGSAHG